MDNLLFHCEWVCQLQNGVLKAVNSYCHVTKIVSRKWHIDNIYENSIGITSSGVFLHAAAVQNSLTRKMTYALLHNICDIYRFFVSIHKTNWQSISRNREQGTKIEKIQEGYDQPVFIFSPTFLS